MTSSYDLLNELLEWEECVAMNCDEPMEYTELLDNFTDAVKRVRWVYAKIGLVKSDKVNFEQIEERVKRKEHENGTAK